LQLINIIIIKNELGRVCGTYGLRREVYRFLVGKPEKMRSLGRPRPRWDDDINIGLQEVG